MPTWLGFEQESLEVSIWEIAKWVLILLGVPLLPGFLTPPRGERRGGAEWYEDPSLPRIGPVYGLLFTIVVLFALQGEAVTSECLDVARIPLPLLASFAVMWGDAVGDLDLLLARRGMPEHTAKPAGR